MNILNTIGNTPLVKLNQPKRRVRIFAKLEGQNPGGSLKDRAALYMIEQAEKKGLLNHKKTIIEASSGNMGISLAMIGAVKGYKVTIAMSEKMSAERRQIIKSYGAKLILTDYKSGTLGALKKVQAIVRQNPESFWFANQFNNAANILAHYHLTAPEILRQLPSVDYVLAGIGTSGTIMGIAKYVRQAQKQVKIIGVKPSPGYRIQGLQNPEHDFAGRIFNSSLLDGELTVSPKQALAARKNASLEHGLFLGQSAGAVLHASLQIAKNLKKATILAIMADRGEKYLSLN